jgi:acid phosphatase
MEKARKLSETSKERLQLHWIDSCLSISTAQWKIVVGHHTIYSGGEHGDNTALIYLLEPILLKHHVDMYICGHDHHLEMLKPIKGIHYLVTGGGGKHRDVTWRENTEFAHTNCGYNFIRIGTHDAMIEFFDKNGKLLYATTLFKESK